MSFTSLPMSGGSVPSSCGKKSVRKSKKTLSYRPISGRQLSSQSVGTGMINPYGQSQLPELTRERVRLVEVEFRERDQFAYVWRQRAFIAWGKKESVRKSKKTLSYFDNQRTAFVGQSVGSCMIGPLQIRYKSICLQTHLHGKHSGQSW